MAGGEPLDAESAERSRLIAAIESTQQQIKIKERERAAVGRRKLVQQERIRQYKEELEKLNRAVGSAKQTKENAEERKMNMQRKADELEQEVEEARKKASAQSEELNTYKARWEIWSEDLKDAGTDGKVIETRVDDAYLNQLREDVTSSHEKLNELQHESESLRQKKHSYKAKVSSLQEDIKAKKETVRKNAQELLHLTEEVESLKVNDEFLSKQVKEKDQELFSLLEQIKKINTEANDLGDTILSRKVDLDKAREEGQKLRESELKAAAGKLDSLSVQDAAAQLKVEEEREDTLRMKIEGLKAEITAKDNRTLEENKKEGELQRDVARSLDELEEAKALLEKMKAERDSVAKEVVGLREKTSNMEADLSVLEDKVKRESGVGSADDATLEKRKKDMEVLLLRERDSLEERTKQRDVLAKELVEKRKQLAEEQERLKQTKKEVAGKVEALSGLESELSRFPADGQEHEGRLDFDKEMGMVKEEKQRLEKRLAELNKEHEELTGKAEELEGQMEDIEDDIADAQEKLAARKEEAKVLQEVNEKFSAKLEAARAEMEKLENEIDQSRERSEEYEKQIKTLEDKIATSGAELKPIQQEILRAKEELQQWKDKQK